MLEITYIKDGQIMPPARKTFADRAEMEVWRFTNAKHITLILAERNPETDPPPDASTMFAIMGEEDNDGRS